MVHRFKDLAFLQLWHRPQLLLGVYPGLGTSVYHGCGQKKILSFFLFFGFLGPHPRHVEVPRLGVKLELYLLAFATATAMQDP